jgi:hypothetical protein
VARGHAGGLGVAAMIVHGVEGKLLVRYMRMWLYMEVPSGRPAC